MNGYECESHSSDANFYNGGMDVKVASFPVKEFERERYPYATPIYASEAI